MDSEIQKLKIELKKAEEKELIADLQKELESVEKVYKGKCYSSHVLNRIHKATYGWIAYYEDFFIENFKVYVKEWKLYISRRKDSQYISYTRTTSNRIIKGEDNYHAAYNLDRGLSSYKHEITKDVFMKLWNYAELLEVELNNAFKSTVPMPYQDETSIGNAGNETTILRCLKETGIECIDVTKHPELQRTVTYLSIALFQNNRWMPKIYAKQLLEWQIKEIEKSMSSPFSNARANMYDQKKIETIKNFIENEL